MTQYDAISAITDHIIARYPLQKLILFGSCARRTVRRNSDIDLCLVTETNDKRALRAKLTDELLYITEYDVDLLILTPDEWQDQCDNQRTFTWLIKENGVTLYG